MIDPFFNDIASDLLDAFEGATSLEEKEQMVEDHQAHEVEEARLAEQDFNKVAEVEDIYV